MTVQEEIAQLVRELREESGLSQNALARAAGIDPTNFNRIERGRQGRPRQTTLLRIIRGLGLPLTDKRAQRLLRLAGGSPPPTTMLHEQPASYLVTLEPALRELRTTLFRALELVEMIEVLVEPADPADDNT